MTMLVDGKEVTSEYIFEGLERLLEDAMKIKKNKRKDKGTDTVKVTYKHFRYVEELPGMLMPASLVRVMGGTVVSKGGATLATLTLDDDSRAYGLALCCPRDNFSRATGRAVSLGRALLDA
jgi:hypothetical protein